MAAETPTGQGLTTFGRGGGCWKLGRELCFVGNTQTRPEAATAYFYTVFENPKSFFGAENVAFSF